MDFRMANALGKMVNLSINILVKMSKSLNNVKIMQMCLREMQRYFSNLLSSGSLLKFKFCRYQETSTNQICTAQKLPRLAARRQRL